MSFGPLSIYVDLVMTGSVHLQWHNVLFFLIKSGHWLAFSTKKVKKLTDPARIKSCVVLRPLNITWTKPKRRLRFPDELVDARCELQLLLSAIRVSTISVEIFCNPACSGLVIYLMNLSI